MASLGDLASIGRMLVVTGKGGVGKSAVAASLGRSLAVSGQRVLVVEIDPRESLYQLLSAPPSGGEVIEIPLDRTERSRGGEAGRLLLQNLQPKHVIEQMVREHLRIELLARRVLSSAVFQHFIESAPGLKEMAVLAYAMRSLAPPSGEPAAVDTIILDAPATGHGVSLLAAPRVVAQVIEQGPFGRMAREMTAFVADPERLGILVVTKAEEAPAQEAIELFAMLRERVARSPELLVVNALYPPLPRSLEACAAQLPAIRSWLQHGETNDRELRRLRRDCDVPVAELPLLPFPPGPQLVAALGEHLERALDIAADAA